MSNNEELDRISREQRLSNFIDHGDKGPKPASIRRRIDGKIIEPNTSGIGDRTKMGLPWRPMSTRAVDEEKSRDSRAIDISSAAVKLANASDYIGTYRGHNGVLRPEYDMLEPFVIADTEVYVKQAIARRQALMFRNGFELVSELDKDMQQGQKNIDYIQTRFDVMEYVTNRATESFLKDILYNLQLCSNCFLRKIRDEKASPGSKQENNNKKVPIAGYQIIPAHQIMPYLKSGVIVKWRRYFDTGMPFEDIPIDDIVHLKWDVKPSHIFGTPRLIGVRDDIFALRRLEENIELLFINHLFPLFHVKVGNEKSPCTYTSDGNSEIDLIRYQIESMPKEGVFVTDERVEVDSVGAEGDSLDTKDIIAHLKGRVFTGLGVSALDMGEGDTANRATADNISQNLKDAVKADQEAFSHIIRMQLFKEWFMEAPYSLSVQRAVASTHLRFHEIDLDNLIKVQNHIIQLYTNHLITESEARKKMNMKALDPSMRKETHYEQHIVDLVWETAEAKADAEIKVTEAATEQQKALLTHQTKETEKGASTQMALLKAEAEAEGKKAQASVIKAEAQHKVLKAKTAHAIATGGSNPVKRATPKAGVTANKNMPENQHGKNPGPTKAKSSLEFISILKDSLLEARNTLENPGKWPEVSSKVINELNTQFNDSQIVETTRSSYTNQVGMGIQRLKNIVSLTPDPELLSILLDSWADTEGLEDDGTTLESASGRLEDGETSDAESTTRGSDSESIGNSTSGQDSSKDSAGTTKQNS